LTLGDEIAFSLTFLAKTKTITNSFLMLVEIQIQKGAYNKIGKEKSQSSQA
jgi:hypothetical protein